MYAIKTDGRPKDCLRRARQKGRVLQVRYPNPAVSDGPVSIAAKQQEDERNRIFGQAFGEGLQGIASVFAGLAVGDVDFQQF